MRSPILSAQFKRDVRTAEKRNKELGKLRALILMLIEGSSLPSQYLDHPLKGKWKGFRDAHLEPDWLLIYRIEDKDLLLVRTGSHADIFGQ